MFNFKKKVLFGLSVSLVLAMAIGSFALSETQDDTTEVTAGAFTISGEDVTVDQDYTFTGISETNGVLTIISDKEMTIKNTSTGGTNDRIKVDLTSGSEANLILDGVNINTNQGAAFEIKDDATFNVNITLADDSENILKTTAGTRAGLQKNGDSSVGTLAISGTGELKATGGQFGAGIGSGYKFNGSNITITGGTVTATGGQGGAGIGSGASNHSGSTANGSNITISGGTVYAYGADTAAGIGGGARGNGTDITISGGIVTAVGGCPNVSFGAITAGIGSGGRGSAIGNKISGNAVVMAASGGDSKPALEGFDNSDIKNCIVFTGVGTAFDSDGRATAESWTGSEMHDNVTLSKNLEIPIDLTVPNGQTLSIEKDKTIALTGKDAAKYTVEGELRNNGTLTLPTSIEVKSNGKITTLLNYDPQGGSIKTNDDNYITYQDVNGTKKYENLPEAIKEGYDLEGWHTEKTGKEDTKVEPTDDVLLNQHILYANWVESEPPTPTPPTPTPPGPEPTPTPPEPGPEPTPEPTPDPSVNPDGGDGSGSSSKTSDPFMGGVALALLGVATTGAVLVRKLR